MSEQTVGATRAPAGDPAASTAGSNADPDVLTCGRPLADLVDQIDAGILEPRDAHQAGCAFCRESLRDAATSSRALDLLRLERPAVPAGLVQRVMRQIRLTRSASQPVELAGTGFTQLPGRVRVHRHVLAELARAAAAGQAGVVVTRSTVLGTGSGLRVALGLLVDGRTPLPALAVTVRCAVRSALQHATGLEHVEVDLTALDLIDQPAVNHVEP